jgi:hypothetical protein
MRVGRGLFMWSKAKVKQKQSKCVPLTEVGQTEEGGLYWRSQFLKLLWGSVEMGVVSPKKLCYMTLTLSDWAMCHHLHHMLGGEVFDLG